MDDNVRQAIHSIHFFDEFADEFIGEIASVAKLEQHPKGTVIFRQGEPALTLHVVVEGCVSLEMCAPGVGCKTILTIGPGDLLGWSPALQQERLTATARAVHPTVTLQLSSPQLLALCEKNSRFGYEFMRRAALALAKRLSATRLQLLDVYGTEMPHAVD